MKVKKIITKLLLLFFLFVSCNQEHIEITSEKIPEDTVVLYATSWCYWCERSEIFLNKNNIKYIKYDLEQDTISLKNLASILIEKYDFRLHMDKQFITRYKVNEILEKYQLNLIEGHSQRYNTVTILEEFAASSIVKEYKQKKKKFSLESIAKLLKYLHIVQDH